MGKHKKGPWRTGSKSKRNSQGYMYETIYDMWGQIGQVQGDDKENRRANAHLIAAAPELLEALQKSLSFIADLNGSEWIRGDSVGAIDMRRRAKNLQGPMYRAIKKSRGES